MSKHKKRDATASKELILQNAIKLFSTKEFSSVSMDQLAQTCNLNKAMIFYYFKNKKALYEAVIIKVLEEISTTIQKENQKHTKATKKLEQFIITFSKFAWEKHYLSSLFLRELSVSSDISNTLFLHMKNLYQLFCDILAQGEKENEFSSSSSMMLYFMITGSINLMVTTKDLRVEANKNHNIQTSSTFDDKDISSYIIDQIMLILTTKKGEL